MSESPQARCVQCALECRVLERRLMAAIVQLEAVRIACEGKDDASSTHAWSVLCDLEASIGEIGLQIKKTAASVHGD